MKLNKKERLQLSFTLRILEKLYPEEQQYYANHRKAVEDGYELHYSWITEHLSDGLSSNECVFVIDTLDMYTSFYYSLREMNSPNALNINNIEFPGFDGNNETMYMAYTKYFVEDLDRFGVIKQTKKGNYNSHKPMIPKYKKMVSSYISMINRLRNNDPMANIILSENDIIRLLNITGN